jgi:RNA polymerase sigma-70 factor (ECF subfamily)
VASAAEFEALVHPLLDRLYGTALRLTGDATRAEDLVQDACLRGWRFFDKYEPGTNFKAWLFKVMTNLYLNQLRAESRRPETTDLEDIDQRYNEVVGDYVEARSQNPERLALERIESAYVRQTIDALPEMYRVPVVLCDMEGFTYREIADMLEVPIGTIMSRLFRGRKKLQIELMDYARSQGYVALEGGTEDP